MRKLVCLFVCAVCVPTFRIFKETSTVLGLLLSILIIYYTYIVFPAELAAVYWRAGWPNSQLQNFSSQSLEAKEGRKHSGRCLWYRSGLCDAD